MGAQLHQVEEKPLPITVIVCDGNCHRGHLLGKCPHWVVEANGFLLFSQQVADLHVSQYFVSIKDLSCLQLVSLSLCTRFLL